MSKKTFKTVAALLILLAATASAWVMLYGLCTASPVSESVQSISDTDKV
ncbi:MAG: hypothetical protein FWD71_17085 [Oscillospiraceae bacterium]|nr:hypothetical protein [Oscillospiraceae bacterium]